MKARIYNDCQGARVFDKNVIFERKLSQNIEKYNTFHFNMIIKLELNFQTLREAYLYHEQLSSNIYQTTITITDKNGKEIFRQLPSLNAFNVSINLSATENEKVYMEIIYQSRNKEES